jgi:hypothetical protein
MPIIEQQPQADLSVLGKIIGVVIAAMLITIFVVVIGYVMTH